MASSADKKCREDFYDFTADLRLQRGRAYISLSFHVKKVEKLYMMVTDSENSGGHKKAPLKQLA